jgi:imidazolonepropionase-like amidohydrolase
LADDWTKMTTLNLRGGMIWDGLADSPRRADIAIDGAAVASVESATSGGETVDISGLTAIPGLIEGHAHLCFNAAANWREVYDADSPSRMLLRMASAGKAMLEAGITTVRDLGAPTALAVELRDAIQAGLTTGPSLLVAGAPITTTGGHCWFMGGEADGEVELRKAVRQRVKDGCDWIKVMATGGNMTRGTNTLAAQYAVGELWAVVEEAHRLRRRVAAHCHGTAGIRVAVEAGVDTLEHCSFTGSAGVDFDDGLVQQIASKGLVISPTISVGYRSWADDGLKRQRATLTRSFFAADCKVAMSTDCGIPRVPHSALWGGLEVLQEISGISAVHALRLATSTSADLLGLPDRGVLAEGRRADILVVEGDPTKDLATLGRVRLVVKAGNIAHRS